MIRYTLLSNAASTDQGLQHHPELNDLAATLTLVGLELRVTRQTYREQAEVNLASARHGQGVTARGSAVRSHTPETHLRGCLEWLRAVSTGIDRGLHLRLDGVRHANAAALTFSQLFARGQLVFVSGLDARAAARLKAAPDLACRTVPQAVAQDAELHADYLGRAGRTTTYFALVQQIAALGVVAPPVQEVLKRIAGGRDPAAVRELDEPQVINLALLGEVTERYRAPVEQLCDQLSTEDAALGDLPAQFDLATLGTPFERLRAALQDLVPEEQQHRLGDKRGLVNALRISLRGTNEGVQAEFRRRMLALVVRQRAQADPRLYGEAVWLEADTARVDTLAPLRAHYRTWAATRARAGSAAAAAAQEAGSEGGAAAAPDGGGDDAPAPVKQALFELVVNLVYEARFTRQSQREPPPTAALARGLLERVNLRQFDLRKLRTLHPSLPPSGVARNLAERVPLAQGEVAEVDGMLRSVLFPLAPLAQRLGRRIRQRYASQEAQREQREREAFLLGSQSLLQATNYVLGTAETDPVQRAAAVTAAGAVGARLVTSRDQVRRRATGDADGEDRLVEGYEMIMAGEDAAWYPLQAAPVQLARAYLHLVGSQAVHLVRRLVARRLKQLYDQHGDGLFTVLYEHVTWHNGMHLSRTQLARLLRQGGVFEAPRLKQIGYDEAAEDASAGANAWLDAARDPESAAQAFGSEAVQAAWQSARKGMDALLKHYAQARQAATEGPPFELAATLGALAEQGTYDLFRPEIRNALAETADAARLTELVRQTVGKDPAAFLHDEPGEAVELTLPGELAYLTLLRSSHILQVEQTQLMVRLRAGRHRAPEALDARSRAFAGQVGQALRGGPGEGLRRTLELLRRHVAAWHALSHATEVALIDRMLASTVLKAVEPTPPTLQDLQAMDDARILCLGASSGDQRKFYRIVRHLERRDAYATLSDMASRLQRLRRLREELQDYRDLIAEWLDIMGGLNYRPHEAPHLTRLGQSLRQLDEALAVRPEEFTQADLDTIQERAWGIGRRVRSIFEAERGVRLRDRWLGRVSMRFRTRHPSLTLTFVDTLHERAQPPPPREEGGSGSDTATGPQQPEAGHATREAEFQTFSDRVREVVRFRETLAGKDVFVLSPNNPQRQLTLGVLDALYRLKGVHTAVFADISGCQAFLDELRTRVPPHRLFDLTAL